MFCNIFRKFIFTVITYDPVQFFFLIAIDNICRCTALSLVHAHIQGCIYPVGKSPFFII